MKKFIIVLMFLTFSLNVVSAESVNKLKVSNNYTKEDRVLGISFAYGFKDVDSRTYYTPESIDIYIKNVHMKSAKMVSEGSSRSVYEIDNSSCILPPMDPVGTSSIKNYGYNSEDVLFIAKYEDGTTHEAHPILPFGDNPPYDISIPNSAFEGPWCTTDYGNSDNVVESKGPLWDVEGNVFESYIRSLYDDGIVSGYSGGEFKVDNSVTRSQLSKFIVRAFDFEVDTTGERFPDVMDMSQELNTYVQTLKNLGIVNGYPDGSFKPENTVTRGQVTKFITKALEVKGVAVNYNSTSNFSDLEEINVFYKYISYLNSVDYNGDKVVGGFNNGEYRSESDLSRGMISKIIDIARKAYPTLPKGDPIGDDGAVKTEESNSTDEYIFTNDFSEWISNQTLCTVDPASSIEPKKYSVHKASDGSIYMYQENPTSEDTGWFRNGIETSGRMWTYAGPVNVGKVSISADLVAANVEGLEVIETDNPYNSPYNTDPMLSVLVVDNVSTPGDIAITVWKIGFESDSGSRVGVSMMDQEVSHCVI